MNCLRPLKHWDRGFESHLKHGCLCAFILCLCCPVCADSGPATGWSAVQIVLPSVLKLKKLKSSQGQTKKGYRAIEKMYLTLMNLQRSFRQTILRGIVHIFLTGATWRWSASRPGRFTPVKCRRYPLNIRLGGPQRRSERRGDEKNLLPLTGSPSLFLQSCLGSTWRWKYSQLPNLGMYRIYRVFRAQADWTLTHTSHKDTEQSTIEASITLDGVTLTDSLIRWSPNECPSVCREIPVSADKMFWTSNKPAQWTL
jgi:hypothetical protein